MLPGRRCDFLEKCYRVAGEKSATGSQVQEKVLPGRRCACRYPEKCYRVAVGHMIHKKLCTARLAFAGACSDLERLQGFFSAEGWDKKPGQSVWIMIKFIIVSLC